ncbi:MAG: hypothetical protein ABI700_22515 [Chloroflexota bacterium]
MPLLAFAVLLNACAVVRAPEHTRIALFAPFEGRYREIGYNALYAARLALSEAKVETVDLLPVDTGGTEAINHAKALAQDPLVLAAVVLGYDGTSPEVLAAFGDIPVLIVGDWGAAPRNTSTFIFSYQQIEKQITSPSRISITDAAQITAPVIGGGVFALEGFAKLRSSLDGVTVLSSGSLPDADFITRYQNGDPFAPTPGLLATLTYDATRFATVAMQRGSRDSTRVTLEGGVCLPCINNTNGAISFTNGYWDQAPIHSYHYVNGSLTEDIVK